MMTSANNRPEIFLLSLSCKEYFDDLHASLLDQLNRSADIKRAKSTNDATRYLEENNPRAIIVTDEGLAKQKNRSVLEKVLSYVHNGGLVIVGLHFTSFTDMSTFNRFFKDMGLSWKNGTYCRATFEFNPSSSLHAVTVPSSFPGPYSMKAFHIKDAQPNEKIFVPVATSESIAQTQAAVVGAKIGDGHLVYCGDVNAEEESIQVILPLCGL